jgi:hypothetical protein
MELSHQVKKKKKEKNLLNSLNSTHSPLQQVTQLFTKSASGPESLQAAFLSLFEARFAQLVLRVPVVPQSYNPYV